jgi:nucleoid-associated protein YgaU
MRLLSIVFVLFLLAPTIAWAQEKLTEDQAQAELLSVKDKLAQAETKISSLESEIATLKSDIAALETKRSGLETKLTGLKETWKRCQYGRYKVVDGDWLSKISSMRATYNNGKKWPTIFEANKDRIKNPNLIYPGWVLLVPTQETYTVAPGDCMWLIASYLSIYSDAKKWPEVYEANKDKVKDPDMIYPKQQFVIPHE